MEMQPKKAMAMPVTAKGVADALRKKLDMTRIAGTMSFRNDLDVVKIRKNRKSWTVWTPFGWIKLFDDGEFEYSDDLKRHGIFWHTVRAIDLYEKETA